MSYRTDRSMADFVAGALSPPLIMALVGSLVFFLLDILYQGIYRGMLQWVLFFFVFGAVLVARISMQNEIGGRSTLYGLALGGAVWLALQRYVAYDDNPDLAQRGAFINLGLIVLIWWSAHRLTLDCTLVDDKTSGGVGLLDAAGLDKSAPKETTPEKTKKDTPGLGGWWDRYRRYRDEQKRKPRTPGIWVIFFSLAALPLFGLGQAIIPAEDLERRQHAFELLVLYVGSGLGLLLTTSFLGLRSYLRERKVAMPAGITLVWLVFGSVLIGAVLLLGGLLPRPGDPQPQWEWATFLGSQEREPAKFSPFEQKDGKKTEQDAKGQAKSDAKGDNKGEAKGDKKNGQTSKDPKSDGKSGTSSKETKGAGDKDKSGKGEKKESQGDKQNKQEKQDQPDPNADNTKTEPRTPGFLGPLLEMLMKLGKWIIIALVVGVIGFWVLRGLLQFLSNFTLWAKSLLDWFAKLDFRLRIETKGATEKPTTTPRPFSSFGNPFLDGRAKYLSPADLVRYSFAAWQAWGREHDLARESGETALEYARRTGEQYPELGEEAGKLALLYGRLAYSTDALPAASVKSLRTFWDLLTRSGQQSLALEAETT